MPASPKPPVSHKPPENAGAPGIIRLILTAILFTKALYRKTTHSFFDTDINNFGDTFLYKFTFYMNYGDGTKDKFLIFRSFFDNRK